MYKAGIKIFLKTIQLHLGQKLLERGRGAVGKKGHVTKFPLPLGSIMLY